MKEDQIVAIKQVTADLGELLKDIEPTNPGEWWAFERLTNAHKSLRGIDYAKIGQTPLDLPKEKKTRAGKCPECGGKGTIEEANDQAVGVITPCPICQGTGKAQVPMTVG